MSDLSSKFDSLGFDLLGLDNLIYLGGIPDEPPDCKEHCTSCTVSCYMCGAGCPTGTSK